MDLNINRKENNSAIINEVNGGIPNCFPPKNIATPLPIPTLKNNDPLV